MPKPQFLYRHQAKLLHLPGINHEKTHTNCFYFCLSFAQTLVFAVDNGYFIGDGGKGRRVLFHTSTIENGKKEDNYIPNLIKRRLIDDFVSFSNINVIDSDEKTTIINLQKDSENEYYSGENPIELGKAIQAESYIKLVSHRMKNSISLSATITNIETGATEGSFSSQFYSDNEFLEKVHGEATEKLLETLGVKLTAAGKRILKYGSVSQTTATATESEENLKAIKAELARIEKEQMDMLKKNTTEIGREAMRARIEIQKATLIQQQKNEEQRLARLLEDEKRKAEEERISKERSAEAQKKIIDLSKEIEEKAAKIRSQKIENMTILQQIEIIENEKQVLLANEKEIEKSISLFNENQDAICNKEIAERKKRPLRTAEKDASGNMTSEAKKLLESDIEQITLKHQKIKIDNENQLRESAKSSQENLREKIIKDLEKLESNKVTVDSLQDIDCCFRVGNYDGSQNAWLYNLSFIFAGIEIFSEQGTLNYNEITGNSVPSIEEKDKYNEYLDNVEAYDSFFRLNVPYIRVVLAYSIKAADVKRPSEYIVSVDSVKFINLQNNKTIRTNSPNYVGTFSYRSPTLVDWRIEKEMIKAEKKEVIKQARTAFFKSISEQDSMAGACFDFGVWNWKFVFDPHVNIAITHWLFIDISTPIGSSCMDIDYNYETYRYYNESYEDDYRLNKSYEDDRRLSFGAFLGLGLNKRFNIPIFASPMALYYNFDMGYLYTTYYLYSSSSSKSVTYGADGSWTQVHAIGASFPIVKEAVAIDLKYKLYLPFSSELENVHSVTLGIRFNVGLSGLERWLEKYRYYRYY
ncbi:hypothetical protein TRSA_23220 (plasmid) [Treponema saccharophilum]|uniref:Uncharacterized protein n=1 Tax=Treponema saccharophilum DSM 2985 TaxID=907348 RepID=H7EJE8_9SPIR|nr:hypothetical protein TresaDRAFT_1573 [Treponema saccharophilum DSM 2985]BDC97223.1 hypothetical protein TRSA_23220 [Treponema saccharophilum]